MQFTVRDWMLDLVVFIDPDMPVVEALAIMRRRYLDSLIVNKTADNPEYGIITSIDICDKVVAPEKDPTKVKVREIMNSPLITVNPKMKLQDCSKIMREHHIHHLPVADDNGKVIGLISANDFLVAAEAMAFPPGERKLS